MLESIPRRRSEKTSTHRVEHLFTDDLPGGRRISRLRDMTEPTFRGVGVALITIFDEYLALDAKRTADLAAELVSCGVTGVIVAGTTGEAAALNGPERAGARRRHPAALPSNVPVLAGIGAPSTYQALDYLDRVAGAGAGAVLALSLPGGADQIAYYEALAKQAGELPLLAYNYPGASAPGIPVEVLLKLPVQGVKDSSGDPDRLIESKALFDEPIYTGAASLLTLAGEDRMRGLSQFYAARKRHPRGVRPPRSSGDGDAQGLDNRVQPPSQVVIPFRHQGADSGALPHTDLQENGVGAIARAAW